MIITVWSIFSPWRYEIERYPNSEGYNVAVLRNRLKVLLMLKNNEGEAAPRHHLLFNGGRETFLELPSSKETVELEALYQQIMAEERAKRERKNTLF